MIQWLRNNTWPASQVEVYMKDTATHRARWIRENGTKAIVEIIEEYPRLLDTPGMVGTTAHQHYILQCKFVLYSRGSQTGV